MRRVVRSTSVVRPLGPRFPSCLYRWGRNTDSKRTLASVGCCAALDAPASNHFVSTMASTPSRTAVGPYCRSRRKLGSIQMRQTPRNRVYPMLHKIRFPQVLVRNDGQHVGRPSVARLETSAACFRGNTLHRLKPRPPWSQNLMCARSCAVFSGG